MPYKRCVWGKCGFNTTKAEKSGDCRRFVPFPKGKTPQAKAKAALWLKLCSPQDAKTDACVKAWDYVCSTHFKGGEGPLPGSLHPLSADLAADSEAVWRCHSLASAKRKTPVLDRLYRECKRRKMQDGATASPQETSSQHGEMNHDDVPRDDNLPSVSCQNNLHSTGEAVPTLSASPHMSTSSQDSNMSSDSGLHSVSGVSKFTAPMGESSEKTTQTDFSKLPPSPFTPGTSKQLQRKLFVQHIMSDDATCFFETGIPNIKTLNSLFCLIENAARSIKLWSGSNKLKAGKGRKRRTLKIYEEYLLTLCRTRRGYSVRHVGYLFGVNHVYVTRVYITWVPFLAKALAPLVKWPSREALQKNLPRSFHDFPNTISIIDGAEFFTQKPYRPTAQRSTWSNYKHHNTFKLLVSIAPWGAFSYVSKLFNGSVSDLTLVQSSGYLNLIKEGDDIMADRGFNIRHLTLTKKASLNIPAYSNGKVLSVGALMRSRRIASVRIHVERAIRRLKCFLILKGVIPLSLRFQLNNIISLCAALCNLQECLA